MNKRSAVRKKVPKTSGRRDVCGFFAVRVKRTCLRAIWQKVARMENTDCLQTSRNDILILF